MNINELRTLPRDRLVEIAARKNKKGNATREARSAQRVLQERSGYWPGVSRKPPSVEGWRIKERGDSRFTKKFK